MSMLKSRIRICCGIAAAVSMFVSSTAVAVPVTYAITGGSVVLSVTDSGGNNVLQSGSSLTVPLGGSFVTYDAAVGSFGAITDLKVIPTMDIFLDLDETVVALTDATVTGAMLTEAAGAIGLLDLASNFTLDTKITGTVTGTLGAGLGGGPFGPAPVDSDTSGAGGTFLLLGGGSGIDIGVFGVNLASFGTLANPTVMDVVVKADFTFFGVVPEPGTAILLGLGLVGLGASGRSRQN